MSSTLDNLLDQLHLITAETLTDIIRNGVDVFDKEGNSVGKAPAPAAYIAAAIKFLKDNDITADKGSARFNPLKDAVSNIPVFDDDEEFDRPHLN